MIRVRNWERFQDKRVERPDRKSPPPWIKLWASFFDDDAVWALPAAQFRALVWTWGRAARNRNEVPDEDAYWRAAFGKRGPAHRDALIAAGFLEIGSSDGQMPVKCPSNARQLTLKKPKNAAVVPLHGSLDVDVDVENPLAGAKRAAGRDEIWDVLVEIFKSSPAPKTSAHGARNKAVHDLKANGATPELIRLVARKYAEKWGKDKLTDVALAKHYPALAGDIAVARRNRQAACPECGIGGGQHTIDCARAA